MEVKELNNNIQEWKARYYDIKFLNSIFSATQKNLHIDDILNNAIDHITVRFNNSGIAFHLVTEDSKTLSLHVYHGIPPGLIETDISISKDNIITNTFKTKKPVFIEKLSEDDRIENKLMEIENVLSYAGIPLIGHEDVLGVFGLYNRFSKQFSEHDHFLLSEIGHQLGIAISNTLRYDQIRTSEKRYRTLFESDATGLVILDDEHRFCLVNRAFETLCGLPRESLIGKMTLTPFLAVKNNQSEEIIEKLNNTPQNWEAEFVSRDGVLKQVYITTTRIPQSSNTLVSMIDMTRERELEKQLFYSEKLASIGELSAGIAHEIRNPLVVIKTSVDLLREESHLSTDGNQLLTVLKEESDHLAAIVEDFLKFAKPKKPSLLNENINKLLKDVIKRYREISGYNIQWMEKYDKTIKPLSLDRHQIQQVITNLLLNSIDAMPDGGILKIETRFEKNNEKDMVRIMITDSGIGISEDKITKIFQPFFSTKEKGTGMGLAICRRIIHDHNGKIQVESEVGKGSCFSILLPLFEKKS
jgi:PAS domain S-box-containing protein